MNGNSWNLENISRYSKRQIELNVIIFYCYLVIPEIAEAASIWRNISHVCKPYSSANFEWIGSRQTVSSHVDCGKYGGGEPVIIPKVSDGYNGRYFKSEHILEPNGTLR